MRYAELAATSSLGLKIERALKFEFATDEVSGLTSVALLRV